jgi:hypothetical protein
MGDSRFEMSLKQIWRGRLVLAAEAGRWGLVERIAGELTRRDRRPAGAATNRQDILMGVSRRLR